MQINRIATINIIVDILSDVESSFGADIESSVDGISVERLVVVGIAVVASVGWAVGESALCAATQFI